MKICSICKAEKPYSEFHKHLTGLDGLRATCKICRNLANREYEKKNAEKIALRKAKYRDNNREKIAAQKKIYHASVREKRNNYQKNRFKTNINHKLKCLLRCRVSDFLKGKGIKAGSAVRDLGCSVNDFKKYLESKFTEGMTWENQGEWHIDHIIPLYKFDLTDREQFLKAAHYTNMQPLWAIDNFKKNRKY